MRRLTIGVDPGREGAIAGILSDGGALVAYAIPLAEATELETVELLRLLLCLGDEIPGCALEAVKPFPRSDKGRQMKLADSGGWLRGVVQCHPEIRAVRVVDAVDWQRDLGIRHPKATPYRKRKIRLREVAQSIYPSVANLASKRQEMPTNDTADAILIAEWHRRRFG